MIIYRISRSLARGEWLQILRGHFKSACDARVNVVTLLKIDVFKEIAAHGSSGDGVAIHVDSDQVGNRALHWHQPLAKVLVNAGIDLWRHHKSSSMLPSPFLDILKSTMHSINYTEPWARVRKRR